MTTPDLKLLDSFKVSESICLNFASELSKDDRFFITADSGLFIITQRPNLNSQVGKYSCIKHYFKPSNFAICDNVNIDLQSFLYELPRDIFYETFGSSDLAPNVAETPAIVKIKQAQWSDVGMVDNAFCIIGVLTSLHSLEIYMQIRNENNMVEFRNILNVSEEIIKQRSPSFVYGNRMPPIQKNNELRKRVEFCAPLVFQWSHCFSCDGQNCSMIFIGHSGGDISIWKVFSLRSAEKNARCEFICRYSTKLGNISALYWHQTKEYGGALCIGDKKGKIAVLQIVDLNNYNCCVRNEVVFSSEEDVQVDKLTVASSDKYTFLLAIKQSYVLIFGLSESGEVFDFIAFNVGNFYISGISLRNNVLKVCTFTGVCKELILTVENNTKIHVSENTIPIKYDFCGYRVGGYFESTNGILSIMVLCPCRLINKKNFKQMSTTVCVFYDTNPKPLQILLDNNTGSLRTFWDCFECLRLICINEQRFPWLGLSSSLEIDNQSVMQLKTLRNIAKISETVFPLIKKITSYEIKPFILLHYLVQIKLIVQRVGKLLEQRSLGIHLTLFELRSIDLQVCFLKELVIGGFLAKAKAGLTFVKEISKILAIANEIEFPDMLQCQFCGDKLISCVCLPPHPDSRCVFSMMPILIAPSYKCLLCNSLAHPDIEHYNNVPIICPYCDFPMEAVCLSDKFRNGLDDCVSNLDVNGEVRTKCYDDCFKDNEETIGDLCDNLEYNEVLFNNISDDEEGDGKKEDELKNLYFKLKDMTFTDKVEFKKSLDAITIDL